ncbi:DNA-binding protein [Ideonella livida]|uniref:KfrA N-terminal DNA-binding domain-containing protein n=1 Tax=Ideonella livida TaxID=2707176 RepID=A0A7C9PFG1_9BURK|nr:DNA-binding protein [Ideonella livida]NDY90597.1 hypothetical protein [Ideonella livida]
MSRPTDTRARTREVAQRWLGQGRLPHEVTVDLVRQEIQQGSRTTINEELRAWRLEVSRSATLALPALPPPLGQAIQALWVQAVDLSRSELTQEREALAMSREQWQAERDQARQACTVMEQRLRDLEAGQQTLQESLQSAETALAHERQERRLLQDRLEASRQQRDAERQQALDREQALTQFHQQALEAHQRQTQTRESEYRAEVSRITERMESVQRHVLRQLEESREQLRKWEQQTQLLQRELDKTRQQAEDMRREASAQQAQAQARHEVQQNSLKEEARRWRDQAVAAEAARQAAQEALAGHLNKPASAPPNPARQTCRDRAARRRERLSRPAQAHGETA